MNKEDILGVFLDSASNILIAEGYGLFWKDGFFVEKIAENDVEGATAKSFHMAVNNKEAAIVVATKMIELCM